MSRRWTTQSRSNDAILAGRFPTIRAQQCKEIEVVYWIPEAKLCILVLVGFMLDTIGHNFADISESVVAFKLSFLCNLVELKECCCAFTTLKLGIHIKQKRVTQFLL